jgi:hypothetical protein
MGRIVLAVLVAFAAPVFASSQNRTGGGAPVASHASVAAVAVHPAAGSHPMVRVPAPAQGAQRSSGSAFRPQIGIRRIHHGNRPIDGAPLPQNVTTDFGDVPGLGFDYPHLAAVSGHRNQGGRFGEFPFGFNGGFLFGSPSVIVEEMPSSEAQADPVDEGNVDESETDRTLARRQPISPRAYDAQNSGGVTAQAPVEDSAEYVFVRRDGGLVFAVAYSWENGMLRYVTHDGMRRTIAREAIDLSATQQFNEQRGLNFRSPA